MSSFIHNLILSGGVAHDYTTTSPMLADLLTEGGIASEVWKDFDILTRPDLQRFDVITLNCVRWSCRQNPGWQEWAFEITPEMERGILSFLAAGKGLVALHAATINFDTWPEYARIIGGFWEWGKAGHGPYQPGWQMSIVDHHHPITEGIEDFEIHDELYHTLTITRPVRPLLITLWDGKLQPMAWTTNYGTARIHYNALGHGPETFQCEPFREMLRRGVLWAAKQM